MEFERSSRECGSGLIVFAAQERRIQGLGSGKEGETSFDSRYPVGVDAIRHRYKRLSVLGGRDSCQDEPVRSPCIPVDPSRDGKTRGERLLLDHIRAVAFLMVTIDAFVGRNVPSLCLVCFPVFLSFDYFFFTSFAVSVWRAWNLLDRKSLLLSLETKRHIVNSFRLCRRCPRLLGS